MKLTALTMPLVALAFPALAYEPAWPDLSDALYEGRVLNDGGQFIAIDTPYRTGNDARTQIAAQIAAPQGLLLGSVTLILDENPMPVSAVFNFDAPLPRFFFDVTMRINGPTPLHVIAETTDGQLFVAETFVKTSGQGACSAPPGSDLSLALATLGEMTIGIDGTMGEGSVSEKLTALSMRQRRLDLDISHPSLSGMQMDQISLLFIPMRYVETVEIDLDGHGYVDMTGSISLSENPRVSLSVPGQTQSVDVTMTDTDGTVTHANKRLTGY
ncbi:quinoprotein dehydrogenase-associated SoxYZ-like carrier [Puniceibacterium sp. IMCC21224]|uniref:quinoprotein dehydrogenase-associated SoxYZ-like carrier n=1 Tax=Puniceibacterium sp. IMCC21224 TaxID=1618204 RepID=UPI00064D7BCA|nr:quinoprotein dehydrogenase-associated SoxYZ-like carrier [Puniceibacterium sp. IMCC21224]KMK65480.1 putative secreted protein [Puniceibacterium sp. IMCC21224]